MLVNVPYVSLLKNKIGIREVLSQRILIERRKRRMTRNCKIIVIVSLLVFSVLYLSGCAANDESKYKNAQSLLGKGQYSEAAEIFDSLGSYEDSTKLSMYAKAVIAGESGDYETAFSAFRLLEDLKDSKQLLVYYQGRRYQSSADSLIESKDRYDLVRAKND